MEGISRLESLKGALAANLITDLIIDETTARALISPTHSTSVSA
ncbi:MAG: hypothetical protein O3B98_01360 [Actinobacteria bacterium]|nr:hypothetical protein [Actinomycetota bacterium]MDA3002510.1 hypothetical protein [Actinomycetota bacterium]